MKIFVRPPDGKKKDDVEVDINPDELIEGVRKKIQDKKGFDCHKLIFKGVSLKDDKTLRAYDVLDGSTIIAQGEYHNQYMPMGVQPQMEKRKLEEAADLVELAPDAKRIATEIAVESLDEAKIPWVGIQCATYGEKGMRRQMEDEHLICPSLREQCPSLPAERDFALFAIFDGHGGKQVAGFVKTYLALELGNGFAGEEPKDAPLTDKRIKKIIELSFQRLDARIASELPNCYDGCTAVVLLVNPELAICANLGDSMAYLCRQGQEEEMQAIPLQLRQHKCWMMKEKERILRAGGAVENGRINGVLEVSRAFGDITLKKFGVLCTPEYMKFKIDRSKDRFVLLACDGFWNAWTANEAMDHVTELLDNHMEQADEGGLTASELKDCCREIVQHVVEEKKAQDNVSVLILQFKKE